jgi:hypothetical protein
MTAPFRPAGPDTAAAPQPARAPGPAAPPSLARTAGMLVLDVVAPIVLYYSLHAAGASNLVALAAGAVVPAVGIIVQLITKRHIDGVGGIVVATAVTAIVLSVVTSSPRFLLAKDGLITAVWGLWFLASMGTRRPAAFVMARPFMEGRRTFSAGSWDDLWTTDPVFRHIWRVATVMWGMGLLADAVLRVAMSYTLPIPVVPGLGAALWPVTFVVLQIVSNMYYHRAGLYRILGAAWVRPGYVPFGQRKTSGGSGDARS